MTNVKKIGNEWFMYFEDFDSCANCDFECESNKWINIQEAINEISRLED